MADLSGQNATFTATLPAAYKVVVGGVVENSVNSQAPIAAVVPLMLLVTLTLTMIRMLGFRLAFIVFCAAPLGLIGVVAALVPSARRRGLLRSWASWRWWVP